MYISSTSSVDCVAHIGLLDVLRRPTRCVTIGLIVGTTAGRRIGATKVLKDKHGGITDVSMGSTDASSRRYGGYYDGWGKELRKCEIFPHVPSTVVTSRERRFHKLCLEKK